MPEEPNPIRPVTPPPQPIQPRPINPGTLVSSGPTQPSPATNMSRQINHQQHVQPQVWDGTGLPCVCCGKTKHGMYCCGLPYCDECLHSRCHTCEEDEDVDVRTVIACWKCGVADNRPTYPDPGKPSKN